MAPSPPRGGATRSGRYDGADEEAAVDRGHAAAVVLARRDYEDADHRGDHADHRHDQREDQAVVAERHLAQDQRGDQQDRLGLERVRGHAGAVTDVVGDRRGVARVILGMFCSTLPIRSAPTSAALV